MPQKLSEKLAGLGAACDAFSRPVDVDDLADEAAVLEGQVATLVGLLQKIIMADRPEMPPDDWAAAVAKTPGPAKDQ